MNSIGLISKVGGEAVSKNTSSESSEKIPLPLTKQHFFYLYQNLFFALIIMNNNGLEHIKDEIHSTVMSTLKNKQKKTPSFFWLLVSLLEPHVEIMLFHQVYVVQTLLRQKNTYDFSSTTTIYYFIENKS